MGMISNFISELPLSEFHKFSVFGYPKKGYDAKNNKTAYYNANVLERFSIIVAS